MWENGCYVGKYEEYVAGERRIHSLFCGIRRQDSRRVGIFRLCLGGHSQLSGRMCEHQYSLGNVCGNAKVNVKSTWLKHSTRNLDGLLTSHFTGEKLLL